MYKQPQMDENYKEQWLKAERELALGLSTISTRANNTDNEQFSRDDFFRALKKASQKIDKPKVSPEPSKT